MIVSECCNALPYPEVYENMGKCSKCKEDSMFYEEDEFDEEIEQIFEEEWVWKEEKNIIRKYLNARIIEVKKEPWEYWCDQELDFLEKELDHLNEECTICKRYSGGQ